MITIKSDREINLMRTAGKILAEIHEQLGEYIKPGLSTYEIDMKALDLIKKHHVEASFYHLYDFPGNFCISVNDEIIHGIPSKDKIIKDGDIVKIDGGVCYKGYHSDAARTHIVGNTTEDIKLFVDRVKQSFYEGIKNAIVGNHIQDIGGGIEDYIKPFKYGILKDYEGHGIGEEVHEDPEIPNFRDKKKGPKLQKNMTLAIEPMMCMGNEEVFVDDDEWTVISMDGSMTAHYENTILITDNEPEILSIL